MCEVKTSCHSWIEKNVVVVLYIFCCINTRSVLAVVWVVSLCHFYLLCQKLECYHPLLETKCTDLLDLEFQFEGFPYCCICSHSSVLFLTFPGLLTFPQCLGFMFYHTFFSSVHRLTLVTLSIQYAHVSSPVS